MGYRSGCWVGRSVMSADIMATLSSAGYDFSMPLGRLRLLLRCFLADGRELTDRGKLQRLRCQCFLKIQSWVPAAFADG